MKVCVMGTGGLGGFLGALAARAGHDVTFIARGSQLQAIQANGLLIKTRGGDILVKPAQATDNPALVGTVDLVLFCVKAYDAEIAGQQIKPLIGADTVVIPVLNGIDHIETLIRHVGVEHVLGGLMITSAHREAPGIISVHSPGAYVRFGELGGGSGERSMALQVQLGLEGVLEVPDITSAMWQKLASVCGAGLCSVVRGNFGVVTSNTETVAMYVQCVTEVIAVANARSIALEAHLAEDLVETLRRNPHVRPSMLVDLERGDRLEVEWLNGAASRMGRALNVPTPVNDFVYACLKPWANGTPPG